jgi:hypothetical protein
MRFPFKAAILFAALPGAAYAQSINPSGITLPHFQTSALLTSNAPVLTQTDLKIPVQSRATIAAPADKTQLAANTAPEPSVKP